jgi:hypothetical protein
MVARAAKRYGVRPSALLGVENEWLALVFDLGMAMTSEKETGRNMKAIERQSKSGGGAFPVIVLNDAAED